MEWPLLGGHAKLLVAERHQALGLLRRVTQTMLERSPVSARRRRTLNGVKFRRDM